MNKEVKNTSDARHAHFHGMIMYCKTHDVPADLAERACRDGLEVEEGVVVVTTKGDDGSVDFWCEVARENGNFVPAVSMMRLELLRSAMEALILDRFGRQYVAVEDLEWGLTAAPCCKPRETME